MTFLINTFAMLGFAFVWCTSVGYIASNLFSEAHDDDFLTGLNDEPNNHQYD